MTNFITKEKRLIILSPLSGEVVPDSAHIRFSARPDGSGMTSCYFPYQRYTGFSMAETAPEDNTQYTWVRIVGEIQRGKQVLSAPQLVAIMDSFGSCAYFDTPPYIVTWQVEAILRSRKPAPTYTVTWNVDGVTTQTTVTEGDFPVYPGEQQPTREQTAQYSYTFSGWAPALAPVTGNVTYTAQFEGTVRTYKITWRNGTDAVESYFDYGQTPEYTGVEPTKPTDEQYTYAFSGWIPALAPVTGDAEYTAQFDETVRTYEVLWRNGTNIISQFVEYGQIPVYPGTTPTKPATAQYSYVFDRWDPEVVAVTGDAWYSALFTETLNKYTVKWLNYDGTTLEEKLIDYGQTPEYTGTEPTKPTDEQYTYTFNGWDKEMVPVTEDATYTAVYESVAVGEDVDGWYEVRTLKPKAEGEYQSAENVSRGEFNRGELQAALNSHNRVRIATAGDYPLSPVKSQGYAVDIRSAWLDLNGSKITSTLYAFDKATFDKEEESFHKGNEHKHSHANDYKGTLFRLSGMNPTIQNGEIASLYDLPDGYSFVTEDGVTIKTSETDVKCETESLVSPLPYGYTNATVENLDLHNCWGYAICERGTRPIAYRPAYIDDININVAGKDNNTSIGGTFTAVEGGYEYLSNECVIANIPSNFRNIQPPYSYVCAHYYGYMRDVSDRPVVYIFKTENGTEITNAEERNVPGMPVIIPSGTVSVRVKLFWKTGSTSFKSWMSGETRIYQTISIMFFNYEGGLNVINCNTHHNHSLGMVGAATGKTYVDSCESWRNGMPYDGAVASRNTIGFIDIEDVPSPYVTLDNCTSHDEKHFALLGAINIQVFGCSGTDVVVYRGWGADVRDTEACIYTFGDRAVPLSMQRCTVRGYSGTYPSSVTGTECTFYAMKCRPELFVKSKYVYTAANVPFGDMTGVCNLTVENRASENQPPYYGIYGLGIFAPAERSNVNLIVNGNEQTSKGYTILADGDCYGVTSDEPILPCGHTIYSSKFTPGGNTHLNQSQGINGTYDGCTFDLSKNSYHSFSFSNNINGAGNAVVVNFINCEILNNTNFFLYNSPFAFGVSVTLNFQNCHLQKKSNICNQTKNLSVLFDENCTFDLE